MLFSEFSEFYKNVISAYTQELLVKSENFGNCLKVVDSSYMINRVYRSYQKKKTQIKSFYMAKGVDALDGHKVAACFMYALLKNKLIKVNKFIPGLPEDMLMANECLAIYTALNIVDIYRRKRSEDKNFKIIIPETYHDKASTSSFISNLCKCMYYIKKIKYFDIFAYSTILFQLEKYTDIINEKNKKS